MKKITKRFLASLLVAVMVLTTLPFNPNIDFGSLFAQRVSAAEGFSGMGFFNGHYYKVFPGGAKSTWEEAKLYCESLGGYLAVISSQEENEYLYNYIVSQGFDTAYFGYTDSYEEEKWEWVANESSYYTHWHEGEPNQENTDEDFAEFYWKYTDGTWNDGNFSNGTASDKNSFICEWAETNTVERILNSDKHNTSNLFVTYEKELVKNLPVEARDAFLKTLDKEMEKANQRSWYDSLASKLSRIRKKYPDGKVYANNMAKEWAAKYKRRSAMLEELRYAGFDV